MSDLLQEYKDYYRVRAERYADNPKYKNSYEAEKKLSDAMQGCSVLEEFKDRLGNLNQLCAVALTKDKYLMEKAFFDEFQEKIRVKAADQILAKADEYKEVFDLIQMVTETEGRVMTEISMDEANRLFHYMWMFLDRIEIYSQAEVPSQYAGEMKETVDYYIQSIRDAVKDMHEQNHLYDPTWKHDPDVNTEYRHRRLLPYKDEHISEMLTRYKQIINQ